MWFLWHRKVNLPNRKKPLNLLESEAKVLLFPHGWPVMFLKHLMYLRHKISAPVTRLNQPWGISSKLKCLTTEWELYRKCSEKPWSLFSSSVFTERLPPRQIQKQKREKDADKRFYLQHKTVHEYLTCVTKIVRERTRDKEIKTWYHCRQKITWDGRSVTMFGKETELTTHRRTWMYEPCYTTVYLSQRRWHFIWHKLMRDRSVF